MTFARRGNHLMTHLSERIPIVKQRMTVLCMYPLNSLHYIYSSPKLLIKKCTYRQQTNNWTILACWKDNPSACPQHKLPHHGSLLWWIRQEYMGYTLSTSFSKHCSLEVMSFILNSTFNKITKIDNHMTNHTKTNTSCDSLRNRLTKTTVAQFYYHSLLILWNRSSLEQRRTYCSCLTKTKTRSVHVTLIIHMSSEIFTVQ